MIGRLRSEKRFEGADSFKAGLCFPQEVLNFERGLIKRFSPSKRQRDLRGVAHGESVINDWPIIKKRHPDLLNERSLLRRRPRQSNPAACLCVLTVRTARKIIKDNNAWRPRF